jgi:hypothetical protein
VPLWVKQGGDQPANAGVASGADRDVDSGFDHPYAGATYKRQVGAVVVAVDDR